jgi:putative membrane protein
MEDKIKLKKVEASLSNERTFLSYIRTSAAVLVLACALFKFFDDKTIIYLGYVVLIMGLLIFLLGLYRFVQERRRIAKFVVEV